MDEIKNIIAKFANCFDLKDWAGLRSTLHDTLQIDYRDLRGKAGHVNADDYVAQREKDLQSLAMHHLITNIQVGITGDKATSIASALIYRKKADTYFNTHAIYHFGFEKVEGYWLIRSIKQQVLWHEGERFIHSGAK